MPSRLAVLQPVHLRTERRLDPLGIDVQQPRLSWRIDSQRHSTFQGAYQVQAARSPGFGVIAWDSDRVAGAQSQGVRYGGERLESRARMWWRVRLWDREGHVSAWSPVATWEMGLLSSDHWQARWIGFKASDMVTDPVGLRKPSRGSMLRRTFELATPPSGARLYISALGTYAVSINGASVTDDRLAPGWTDYRRRVQYNTFDVTRLLQTGTNVVGVRLAPGWYAGRVGWFGPQQYGDEALFLCQLEADLEDGSRIAVNSGLDWHGTVGPETVADLLTGERFDGRDDPVGWDRPGYDAIKWAPVQVHAEPGSRLVAPEDDGVRVVQTLIPKSVRSDNDRWIVDFGQNIAGHVAIAASGPPGAKIEIRHAEMLEPNGELYTMNLRTAEAVDSYTFRGGGVEVFEPRFTFHGFRYAEVRGLAAGPVIDRIAARAISSATRTVGEFQCSDALVNQIHQNAFSSLRANFISIPMDCPQRDERLGWAADVDVFAPTALFLADLAGTLRKWLQDLVDGQHPSGAYPDFAPVLGSAGYGNAGWSDAGVFLPWTLYERTGDLEILERQYRSMRRYLEYLERDHTNGIRPAGRYGDWLSLGPPTSKELIGTAYLARSAETCARIARLLRRPADRRRFERLSDVARSAFLDTFVDNDGIVAGDTQTGYAIALAFELLPLGGRQRAADRLAALVRDADIHLQTGFLGTPLVLPVLSAHGHHDLACQLALQDSYPSWGFEARQGATTIWERWNGWTTENGFGDPIMNSFNHYAFGCVADWMHRHLAGLSPSEPGYRRVRFQPGPGATFRSARASHESVYGRQSIDWRVDGDLLWVEVEVAPNTRGDVVMPSRADRIRLNGRPLGSGAPGVEEINSDSESTCVTVGSGCFRFESPAST